MTASNILSRLPRRIKSPLKRLYSWVWGGYKIDRYLKSANNKKASPVLVVFGGHWSVNPGWLILNEREQDITRTLRFPDVSVDMIFTEHVIEHLSFEDAIHFFKEAKRILKPGGVFRVVCPILDRLIEADFSEDLGKRYIKTSIIPAYAKEHEILKSLGVGGVCEEPKIFFFNGIFMHWGHKFIWSSALLRCVLERVGFSKVNECVIGDGLMKQHCIERRNRGIYLGNSYEEDRKSINVFDPESGVIECIK